MFGLAYCPPSSSVEFVSSIASSLRSIPPNLSMYLCGDFNLPLVDWAISGPTSSDKLSVQFCDTLHDFSLCQLVRDPTRGDNVLDLVLTNNSSSVSHLQVCDSLPGTDHDAVQFMFSTLPPKQLSVHHYLYNYKKANFDKFRETLSSVPWEMAEANDIDSWWEDWKDLFFCCCFY